MANAYTSPMYQIDELLSGFRDMNIRCEKHDFLDPDLQRWQEIFGQLYECVTEVPLDQLIQNMSWSVPEDNFEFPELNNDSLPLLFFTMAMQRVMCACGIINFTVKDLIEPEPKRLQRLCSALLNFYRFRKDRLEVYYELKEQNERSQDQYKQLLNKNDELKRKINKLKAQKAEQEPAIQKVQTELGAFNKQMEEYHRQKTVLQQSADEIRTKTAEKQAGLDQMKVAISKTRGEIESLSQKIVQSPQKVLKEQEEMKQNVSAKRIELEKKQERLTELQKMKENIGQSETDAKTALKLLLSVQTDVDKEKEIDNEISQNLDKIQEQKNMIRNQQARKEQLKMVLDSRQEKLAKMKLQHKANMAELDQRLAQLQAEQESFMQKKTTEESKIAEINHQRQKLTDEINRKRAEHEKRLQAMDNQYYEILENVDNYHKSLGLGWEEFRTQMEDELSSMKSEN